MTQRLELLAIEVVTDTETGIEEIGEMDFSVPCDDDVRYWIDARRKQLEVFLRQLADMVRDHAGPFKLIK